MGQLKIEILSVKGRLFKSEVDMVVLPGLQGHIGISLGERVFVNVLKHGIIYLFNGNKVSKRYFITGGGFKLNNDLLIVKTEHDIYDLDNLDVNAINKKITDYEKLSQDATSDIFSTHYKNQIEVYNQILKSQTIHEYS